MQTPEALASSNATCSTAPQGLLRFWDTRCCLLQELP